MNRIIIKITTLFILVLLPVILFSNAYSSLFCYTKNETIDIELTHDCCPKNHPEQKHFGPEIYFNNAKDDENNREKCLSCIYKKIIIENSNISKVIVIQKYMFFNILTDYTSISYPDTAYNTILRKSYFSHCPSFYDPVFTVLRI